MPSAECHWRPKPGRRREGEPRVRRPAARRVDHRTPRGREDSCPGFSSFVLAAFARRGRPALGAGTRAVPTAHRLVVATATESLFAIGAGPQVIAVDDQSDYPKNAPKTTLSGFTPNVEAIAGYKPDLVIVAYDPNNLVSTLRGLGIRVLVQDAATTLADAYAQIAALGKVTGHAKRAALRRRDDEEADRGLVAGRHAAGPRPDRLPRARPRPVLGDLEHVHRQGLRALRAEEHRRRRRLGRRAATRSSRPSTSSRRAPTSSSWPTSRAASRARGPSPPGPAGRRVKAVRTGTIVRIDDSIASRWGPRIVNFVRAVAAALAHLKAVTPQALDRGGGGGSSWSPPSSPGSSSGRCTSASGTSLGSFLDQLPFVHVDSQLSPAEEAILWEHPAAAGRRSPRSSARCSRSRAPPTRACSATRSPTRTCSASPRAPGSARRSRSSTCARHATGCRRRRSSAARSPSSPPTRSAAPPAAAPAARRSSSPA